MSSGKTIGGKIVLEGANQYNEDLKDIQSNLKELRSEMKLANAQYSDNENSIDALTTKQDILTKEYDEIGKKVETYQKLLESAKDTQEKAGDSVDSYKGQLSDAKSKLEEMKTSGQATDEELKTQQGLVDDLSGKLDIAQSSYDGATQKVSQYQTALNNASTDQINMGNEVDRCAGYIDEARTSADGCATSIDKFGKSTQGASQEADALDTSISNAVDTMSTMLASSGIITTCDKIKEALLSCDDAADSFETSMAKINTIARLDTSSLSEMGNDILQSSKDLGVSATDIAEATYQAISAGVEVGNSVNFANEATKLSIGGFTDAATVVDTLTTVLNAYGLEESNTQHIADDLVTTQNLGKTTVNDLGASLGKVIPTAAAYGVSIDQVSAAYAELTAKGIKTRYTTTYLNSMFDELGDSGSDVAKTLKEQTGKSFGELMSSGESLGDVLTILYDSVGKDSEAFMQIWGSSNSAKAAIDMASDSGQRYNEILGEMENNAGTTSEAFETMDETGERLDAKLSTAFENLQIALGDAVGPALDDASENAIKFLDPLTEFVEENPEVVEALGGLAVGILAATTAITAAKAAMALFNTVFAANPIGLVTVAVAGLTGAMIALSSEVDPNTEAFNKLTKASKEFNDTEAANAETRKTDRDSLEANRTTVQELVSELEALQSKTSLTNDEQIRQQGIVDELNEALPDLGLAIDDTTGKISMSTEELESNTDALLANYEAAAAQEDLKDIATELYDAEKQLNDLEAERVNTQSAIAEAQSNFNDEMADGGLQASYYKDEITAAEDADQSLTDQINETQATISGLKDEYESTTEMVNGYKTSTDDATTATGDLADASATATDSITEDEKERQEAYASSFSSALENIRGQTGLFTELEQTATQSLTDMTTALSDNVTAYENYGQNLTAAIEFARDNPDYEGVVSAIADMGYDGAGYLQEFVDGIDEDTGKASDSLQKLKDEYSDYEDITNSIATMWADIDTGYTEGYETVNDSTQTGSDIQTQIMSDSYADQETDATEHSEKMVTATTTAVDAMATAVTTETPKVTTAMTTMCKSVLTTIQTSFGIDEKGTTSTVFANIGKLIDTSIAKGISDNKGTVSTALKACLQDAVDSLDVTGIAAKVNTKLGEAMG